MFYVSLHEAEPGEPGTTVNLLSSFCTCVMFPSDACLAPPGLAVFCFVALLFFAIKNLPGL